MKVDLDTTLYPFTATGRFQVRTRADVGRLVFVQTYNSQGRPDHSAEFQLVQSRLQVMVKADIGKTSFMHVATHP